MLETQRGFARRYGEALPKELKRLKQTVEARAAEVGLDFYPVHYELVTTEEMAMLAAQGGFPRRYPHWRFGMAYDELRKGHQYGLQKIYEMVINTDPCIAYLVDTNDLTENKLVMAHVYAHCDFFKNNLAFSATDKRMIDRMGNHAAQVQRHIDNYGFERVESFLDAALSIENLVDSQAVLQGRGSDLPQSPPKDKPRPPRMIDPSSLAGLTPWDTIPPPGDGQPSDIKTISRIPERPESDVLGFLIKHAPLREWQQDLLSIVRSEALYFVPQGRTKIMNEGWATLWHTRLMTGDASGAGLLCDSEIVDYANSHAGTVYMAPGSLNPYRLGVLLYRHVWERWDKGQFGPEWNECNTMAARNNWNTNAGQGKDKVFEVRRVHTDVSFIDAFLDEDFCREQGMFAMGREKKTGRWVVRSRDVEDVREQLLGILASGGQPSIEVLDSNHNNRNELLVGHRHTGRDLQTSYVEPTLANLARIWRRPCLLKTRRDDKEILFRHDGKTFGTEGA